MTTLTLSNTRIDDRQTTETSSDANAIRAAALELAPSIVSRSDEIEQARHLPLDLVGQLRRVGCFRMLVPRRLRGAAADLDTFARMIRELSTADGSVGWTVMIGSMAPVIAGLVPAATFDAIYADGPDLIGAGTFNPTGAATPVEGGYRVSGQWAFASGCQHADWFIGHCMVDDGRMPPLRMMLMPASDVQIVDTWSVSGLCGTGSHDFTANDVFVPDARTFSIFDEGGLEGPMGRIPELTISSLVMANVAIGIAEGALGEVTTLSSGKVPTFADATLAANPLFRHHLARADAQLRAATALVTTEIAQLWELALAEQEVTPDVRARSRSAATWATFAAAEVVDVAYTAGGGSSLHLRNPLQRRLRDVHAVTQHFAMKEDTYTLAGGVLAGQEPDLSFL